MAEKQETLAAERRLKETQKENKLKEKDALDA